MSASNSLLLFLAIYVIDRFDVLAGYLEPLHEEFGNCVNVFALDLHFHALGTVGGLMHGSAPCTFHTEKGHNLFIGDLPEFEAGNDGYLFVGHTLGFDEELRNGASENFLPSFYEFFLVKQGDLIAFFNMLGDNLEYHVLVGFVLRVILAWREKLGEDRIHLNEAFPELQLILIDVQSRQVSQIFQRVELLMWSVLDSRED